MLLLRKMKCRLAALSFCYRAGSKCLGVSWRFLFFCGKSNTDFRLPLKTLYVSGNLIFDIASGFLRSHNFESEFPAVASSFIEPELRIKN